MQDTNPPSPQTYSFSRTLAVPFAAALERTQQALAREGFGVLTTINLKEKLQEKLGVTLCDYVILGACNPPLAYQALQAEIEIGLLLPCNVIVYEKDGQSVVSAIDAAKMMTVVGNPQLAAAAEQVNEKLQRVIADL